MSNVGYLPPRLRPAEDDDGATLKSLTDLTVFVRDEINSSPFTLVQRTASLNKELKKVIYSLKFAQIKPSFNISIFNI